MLVRHLHLHHHNLQICEDQRRSFRIFSFKEMRPFANLCDIKIIKYSTYNVQHSRTSTKLSNDNQRQSTIKSNEWITSSYTPYTVVIMCCRFLLETTRRNSPNTVGFLHIHKPRTVSEFGQRLSIWTLYFSLTKVCVWSPYTEYG